MAFQEQPPVYPANHVFSRVDYVDTGKRYFDDIKLEQMDFDNDIRQNIDPKQDDITFGVEPAPPSIEAIANAPYNLGPDPTESAEATNICRAIEHFSQNFSQGTSAIGVAWDVAAQIIYRYVSYVYMITVLDTLANHVHLGGNNGAQIETSIRNQLNGLIALLLDKVTYSGWMGGNQFGSSLHLKARVYPVQHYMFVLPCIYKLVYTMNLHEYVNVQAILNCDPVMFADGVKRKAHKFGVWDRLYVEHQARFNNINADDHLMCRGIRYEFARIFALVMHGFNGRWNKRKSALYLTGDQMHNIGRAYTADVCDRVTGRPRTMPRQPRALIRRVNQRNDRTELNIRSGTEQDGRQAPV